MREWPKKLYAEAEGAVWKMLPEGVGPYPRSRHYPLEVEVVRADVVRELYEATVIYLKALDKTARDKVDIQPETARLREILIRYEREVGE